jgi:hypothetical protein
MVRLLTGYNRQRIYGAGYGCFTEGSRRGSSKTGSGSDIIKDGPKKRNTKT